MKKLLALGAMFLSCIEISSVSAMRDEDNTLRLEFYDGRSVTMRLSQSIRALAKVISI